MRKTIILLFFVTFQYANATEKDSLLRINAFRNQLDFPEKIDCDACGCAASGGSMGFASVLSPNFVGIRYFNQQYKSRDGLYSNAPWYKENYNTIQVWARIPIFKNIQLTALVPFHFHNRETATGKQQISGLGDFTVLAMYLVYQTKKDSTTYTQAFQVGGGFKAPTGRFNEANNLGTVNQSYQLGTGSWDYQLVAEYVIKRKELGFNSTVNYAIKTTNNSFYRYGNQLNYSGTFFYLYAKDKLSVAPQLGFAGELYASNSQHKQTIKDSSGEVLFGKIGVEMGRDKWSMGLNTMLPIAQNLASGNLHANYRWSLNINYSL